MTNISIPLQLFVKFKDLHGEALAKEYFEVYDSSLQNLQQEVVKETLVKKLELKDELSKELATKQELLATKADLKSDIREVRAEIKEVRAEIKEVRAELNEFKAEMRAEFKILKYLIFAVIGINIVFIGTSNPTFVELIKALIK
ncbi:MAG: hypothetical protein NW207_01860 [Cytophagales bacterium]|nr:hypothetical protein [Cytophagales bacterium]